MAPLYRVGFRLFLTTHPLPLLSDSVLASLCYISVYFLEIYSIDSKSLQTNSKFSYNYEDPYAASLVFCHSFPSLVCVAGITLQKRSTSFHRGLLFFGARKNPLSEIQFNIFLLFHLLSWCLCWLSPPKWLPIGQTQNFNCTAPGCLFWLPENRRLFAVCI